MVLLSTASGLPRYRKQYSDMPISNMSACCFIHVSSRPCSSTKSTAGSQVLLYTTVQLCNVMLHRRRSARYNVQHSSIYFQTHHYAVKDLAKYHVSYSFDGGKQKEQRE